ncbi:tripartite tricarboxylate transporter substrate-binding protein [Roseomonas sp. NAR14]|uniref:Tripartite tricarboxylate transporter substrate-binding protein n=1 Tax=Roseomonas acroporae TaxID=2937791 RepID=A0A9X1Y5Q7_9PROT|nr:tripartite tricarboxylate transporter substrate-binding protein [Roseomonas acroporae]MCK8784449.1 tripartite tricarboxylate transporter substrate-binding protein [Roseomonas acroporae]
MPEKTELAATRGAGLPTRRAILAGAALLAAAGHARAQGYPERPIRFIVPGPAGGAGDVLSRLVAEPMSKTLGVPVVVEDRPGAGTNVGMAVVAAAAPDGYTLGLGSIASNAVNRWLYRSLPFDPERDFAPVGMIALVPNLMVVPPQLPVRDVAEFIAYVKAHPGEVNFGSVGSGSSQHLAGAQFGQAVGVEMTHIPYTNSGQLNTDLMENRVQVLFQSISAVAEMARAGHMRPLAVTGTQRLPAFPDVPTLQEAGVPITSTGWFGIVTPAGVPAPIVERLNAALNAALADPAVSARIVALGSIPRATTPTAFGAFMAAETQRWRPVVLATGATAD